MAYGVENEALSDFSTEGNNNYILAYTWHESSGGNYYCHTTLCVEVPNAGHNNPCGQGTDGTTNPCAKLWTSQVGCYTTNPFSSATCENGDSSHGYGYSWAPGFAENLAGNSVVWERAVLKRSKYKNQSHETTSGLYLGSPDALAWYNAYVQIDCLDDDSWYTPFCTEDSESLSLDVLFGHDNPIDVNGAYENAIGDALVAGAQALEEFTENFGRSSSAAMETAIAEGGAAAAAQFSDCACEPMSDAQEQANIEQWETKWQQLISTSNTAKATMRSSRTGLMALNDRTAVVYEAEEGVTVGDASKKVGSPIRVGVQGTTSSTRTSLGGDMYQGVYGTTGESSRWMGNLGTSFMDLYSAHVIGIFFGEANSTTGRVGGFRGTTSEGSEFERLQTQDRTLGKDSLAGGASSDQGYVWRGYYTGFQHPENDSWNTSGTTNHMSDTATADHDYFTGEAAAGVTNWPTEITGDLILEDTTGTDVGTVLMEWTNDRGLVERLLASGEGVLKQAKDAFVDAGGTTATTAAVSEAMSSFGDLLWFHYWVAYKYLQYSQRYLESGDASAQVALQLGNVNSALEAYLTAIYNMCLAAEKQMCYLCFTWARDDWYARKQEAYADMTEDWSGSWQEGAPPDDRRERASALREASARTRVGDGRNIEVPPFFREQCFLLAQMPYFSEWKRQVIEKETEKMLPYHWYQGRSETADRSQSKSANSNACLQMDGDPFGFMNRLTQYPTFRKLNNMKTSEIANLQPLIRIYKILIDDDGNETQFEVPFDSHFTSTDFDLFRDNNSRGQGVGIKDFTFSFEADNPFAIKKSIKAKLSLFANTFSELLRPRYVDIDDTEETDIQEFKYVDLALKTGSAKSLSLGTLDPNKADVIVSNLDKLNFRIKAVIGWNYKTGWGSVSGRGGAFTLGQDSAHTLSDDVRAGLYDSYITLNLTPVIHEFDIDDHGRVEFNINYFAYIEDFFDQPAFNIFPNTEVDPALLAGERHAMEMKTESARIMRDIKTQAFAAECDSDQISGLKEELASEVEIYRIESMKGIMAEMMYWDKVRYVNLTSNDVYRFRQSGPNWDGMESVFSGDNLDGIIDEGGIQVYEEGSSPASISDEVVSQIEALGLEEEDKQRRLRALAATGADTKVQPVSFFYVSDLIDIILYGMSSKYGNSFDKSILSDLRSLRGEISAQYNFSEGNKMREILEAHIIRFQQMDTQLRKLRILLGPLELVHQGNFISEFYSLGDIPISVKYFIEWLSKKMSDRDEVYYPLPKFINELINDLCRDILNDSRCFRNQARQRIRTNQAACTSYMVDASQRYPNLERAFREEMGSVVGSDGEITEDLIDEITADILMYRMDESRPLHARMNIGTYGSSQYFPIPALNIAGNRGNPVADDGIEKEVNWLVYYAGRTQPVEKMRGIEDEDAASGIFHYYVGADRGLTKKIKLKKTDTTGLKELRFEQDGYDGLKQLREVFDVTIHSYANVQAYPGLYIYVDPAGFSPNSKIGSEIVDLTQIGIGGYHMIIRSEHSFGPGYANTTIDAKWVASTHALVTEDLPGHENDGESRSSVGEERYCFAAEGRMQARQRAAEQERESTAQEAIDAAEAAGSPAWWNPFAVYSEFYGDGS